MWDEVTGEQTGGASILEYTVEFDLGIGSWSTYSTTDTTISFDSLTGGVTYSIKVAAVNKYGTGEFTETLSIVAAQEPDQPDPPITETVGLYVKVQWT